MICPSCTKEIPPGASSCPSCGWIEPFPESSQWSARPTACMWIVAGCAALAFLAVLAFLGLVAVTVFA